MPKEIKYITLIGAITTSVSLAVFTYVTEVFRSQLRSVKACVVTDS